MAEEATVMDSGRAQGLLGRIPGLWFSPGETFVSIVRRPSVLVALLAGILLNIAFTATWLSKVDMPEFVKGQMEERGQMEKIPAEAVVPAELKLLAGPGSGSKLPSPKGCLRFVAGAPFLPVDFAHSPAAVSVASPPEPVFGGPLFASTAPSFPGRSAATRAPPESDQGSFLSLAVPWHYAATLAVGPLLPTDHLLG